MTPSIRFDTHQDLCIRAMYDMYFSVFLFVHETTLMRFFSDGQQARRVVSSKIETRRLSCIF